MNSKERVLRAVNHKLADRTAITFDAEKEVYQMLFKHFETKEKETLFDKLNVDTWMILPRNYIYLASDSEKIEKTSIWGFKSRVTAYSGGTYEEIFHSPLAGKDELFDIKNHNWPDNDILDFSQFVPEAKAHSDRAIIGTFTWGAYFLASMVRGMEDLMIDMVARKEYADHLIKTISEKSEYYLTKMLEEHGEGIDIVYMADDTCSQLAPLFSPETFKEFVAPYLKKFTSVVHKHNKKFLLHTCGSVRTFLPQIIDCGVDMLEPIQITAEGMEPAGLKRDFGEDICFYGGVDLQKVLSTYSSEKVSDEVKRLIDILGKDGGYIMGPGHTYIQPDTPLKNILAMYKTANEYRPYKI
ncbi:MAG: hypothetical protein A2452_02970 [Candidatus Firestonebacteria bacterium RIFOXYC2_FULL_39_67]|nr:MAG: hypothetical protein A2536_02385 [Candidatus Firestonebacteria bacterium RIFOXYD2_FULL_39_29]OGF51985.1 MAG: hypothetical protein A2497_09035 [Candidatus Firestonebacteria bacterium RifOxyC12_full_39_7]OGF55417.1 MAG: hypothetical protein A2452_02970 [Candidatus Firestonebacteria bacterium RIFOXYC2_FULL_39_67]